jgi:hypothetical protein
MVDAKAKMFAPFAAMSPAVFRVSRTVSQAGVAARCKFGELARHLG